MATLPINHTFSNGTTANANEVNANFASVKSFAETALVQVDGSVKLPNSAIDYTSVPQVTVSSSDPSGGKNGDIWIKV